MKRLRFAAGLTALAALVAAANLLVFRKNPFAPEILALIGAGLVAGLVWGALLGLDAVRGVSHEGRALRGLNTVVGTVAFLGICFVAYAFVAHLDVSVDLTQEGRRALSPQTIQVVQNLQDEVSVVCFFMEIDDNLIGAAKIKTERFLKACQKHSPKLKVEFQDPQLVNREWLESIGVTHVSTQGTVVIRCGDKQKVLTLAGTSPRLEEHDFINALINVVRARQPKVMFLTGHGERNPDDTDESRGASMMKNLLMGEAYAVERVGLRISQPEVPEDCDILVINGLGIGTTGPQGDLHPEEIKALDAFVERGGRILVLLDPWVKVNDNKLATEQLRPWLERRFGIVVGENVVVSPEAKRPVDVEISPDPKVYGDTNPKSPFRGSYQREHAITRATEDPMLLAAVRTVSVGALEPGKAWNPLADMTGKLPERVSAQEILRSLANTWAETDVSLVASQGKAAQSHSDVPGPVPIAAAATYATNVPVGETGRMKDARIVVVGDTDFACNAQLRIPGHLNLVLNSFAWLSESEDLIAARAKGNEDAPIVLSENQQRAIVWICVLGTLQFVVLAGFLMYWFRRDYR